MTRQNAPRDERTLGRRLSEIGRRLHILETTPRVGPWIEMTLAAGYSASRDGNYGQGYRPAYRVVDSRTVELRGTVQKGTGLGGVGANGFADADVCATLPAEVRPAETAHAPIAGATTGAANSYGAFQVRITTGGAVTFKSAIAAAPGWIALDGVRYDLT